jgi:hypothetical protein
MKWVLVLVVVLVIGLWLESQWEKKKKQRKGADMVDDGTFNPGEMISELKGKQDGK